MDQHPAVAQHRVEAETVGGRDGQDGEGAGHEREHEQVEGQRTAQHAGGVGLKPGFGSGRDRGRSEQGQDQRPVEQRSLLPRVEGGCQKGRVGGPVGVRGDERQREVMRQQRRLQRRRGQDQRDRDAI